MHQQRLESYFPPLHPSPSPSRSSSRRVSFLDIPAPIRMRIYEACQIVPAPGVTWSPISMNHGRTNGPTCLFDGQDDDDSVYDFYDLGFCHRCQVTEVTSNRPHGQAMPWRVLHSSDCEPLPLALFYTCRTLYAELVDVFYSKNRFDIAYTGRGGLSVLETLTTRAITSLRDLTIRMTFRACRPECGVRKHQLDCHHSCKASGHDEPLGVRPGSRRDRLAVEALMRVIQHLAPHIRPGRLKLSFACDVRDAGVAARLLGSLEVLPTLRSCAISLSEGFDPRLRQMARESSLRMMGYPESRVTGSFPFRRLSRELQLLILSFSGLVAPFHLWYDEKRDRPDMRLIRANCVYNCIRTQAGWEHAHDLQSQLVDLPVICCCLPRRHSTSDWVCNHWHFPLSLFAVDRRMRDDSRTTMYSENIWTDFPLRFIQHHEHHRVQLNVEHFMSSVRHLTYSPMSMQVGVEHPYSIERILGACHPERLTLVLRLPHPSHDERENISDLTQRYWTNHRVLLRKVSSILASRHGGTAFRGFFVGLKRTHTEDDPTGHAGPSEIDCQTSAADLDRIEQELERMVVGDKVLPDGWRVARKNASLHCSRSPYVYLTDWPRICQQCSRFTRVYRENNGALRYIIFDS